MKLSIILLAIFCSQSVLSFRINNFGGNLCDKKYAPVRNGVRDVLNKLGALFLEDFCPLQCTKNVCNSKSKRNGYGKIMLKTTTPSIPMEPPVFIPTTTQKYKSEYETTTPSIPMEPPVFIPTTTQEYKKEYETTTPFIPMEPPVFIPTTTEETTTKYNHYKKRAAVSDNEKLFQIEADLCGDNEFEYLLDKFGKALVRIQNNRFLEKACELQKEHNICECD